MPTRHTPAQRSSLLLPLALAMLCATTAADTTKTPSRSAQVDALFADYEKPDSPGCALGVIQNGRLVYEKAYGLASLEHRLAINPSQTVFDIGSTSKQFTAAIVLLLVQDKKLTLDDDIRKYLPEIPDYGHTITVRHLLHHTSGLRDYIVLLNLGDIAFEDHTTEAQALAAIARQQALDFVPGSEHSYSNTGYFLLAQIAQRIVGKPLREIAEARLFAPLGMRDTRILDNHKAVIHNRATAYENLGEAGFAVQMSDWEQTGDGAVQTTITDLAKWDQNFYQTAVGGRWLIEQLQLTGTLNDGRAINYARGLMVSDYHGQPLVMHGGAWAGYRAELLRLPQQQFSVAVLCNVDSSDPSRLARQVTDIYFADLLKPAALAANSTANSTSNPPTPASDSQIAVANPERYTGMYWARSNGLLRRIEWREGKLWYVRNANNASELAQNGERLVMLGVPRPAELRFSTHTNGMRRLQLWADGEATEFEEVKAFAPTAAELSAFAASFHSVELNTNWQFTVKDGALTVLQPRGPALPLQPAFVDAFTVNGALLRFQRDADQRVTGFAIDVGRAKDMKFVRHAD